jgi:hypothetical protein
VTAFDFIREGEAYSGGPLYRVETPAGVNIGYVASSSGKRATSWMAYTPLTLRSVTGFKNRERAAEFLQRVVNES